MENNSEIKQVMYDIDSNLINYQKLINPIKTIVDQMKSKENGLDKNHEYLRD